VPTTTTLPPGFYGPQPIASGETLLAASGPALTKIVNPGGFYTFGVNFEAGDTGAQLGDLSGHGFTIEATSPGGSAVQILGSNNSLYGNTLISNDPGGNGADLITGGGANNLQIQSNTFAGAGFALAYVNGAFDGVSQSTNVNFVGNTFNGTATAGVDLVFDAASGTISGNSFYGSGDGAIYLGHLSKAAADYFNALYGTSYVAEAGTITLANNDFSHWDGVDIITFDANYTFANGGAGHTLTSTVANTGKEIDTLSGFRVGDEIDLRHGVTATSIQQHGKGEVDVLLSDGDTLVFLGDNIKAKDVAASLGVDHHHHVDNGQHVGFDHSQHHGYDWWV
jgi:hypothetical protein